MLTTLILNTRNDFIIDYPDYANCRDYSTWKIISQVTTLIGLIFNRTWKILPSLTTITTLILECVEISFITNYADYADIQYCMKNNPITDYANYTDFEYQI